MRQLFHASLVLLALLLAGCREKTGELEKSLTAEMGRYSPSGNAQPGLPEKRRVELVETPDPVTDAHVPIPEVMQEEKNNIAVTVLEKRFDAGSVFFTVLLRNMSDKGARTRFYVFGYDRNGRVVSSSDSAFYFQPREQMLQNLAYARASGITRWVLTVR